MRIDWDIDAKASMRQVARYISKRYGRRSRQVFLQRVKETEDLILHHPNVGPIDPLFDDRPKTYRSVVINGLSKMVYFIGDDTIYIAAFWDCRCEPVKQASKVK